MQIQQLAYLVCIFSEQKFLVAKKQQHALQHNGVTSVTAAKTRQQSA
ncbi:hypothetical protein [uncultured Aquitalea sp.]|nr:hypothetical protein [uncultured Aquitalea sp.]